MYHLTCRVVLHGLQQDGVPVQFDQYHDTLIAAAWFLWELSGLVGVHLELGLVLEVIYLMYILRCLVVGQGGGLALGVVLLSLLSLYMLSLAVFFVERRPFCVFCHFLLSSLQLSEMLSYCFCCEARPQCKLPVFDCHDPCWLVGESCCCVVVADKLRLHLELVDVCNSLGWRRLLRKELRWQAAAKNCLRIIVLHMFYEWNVPQLNLVAAPALEDGSSHNCDFVLFAL